MFKKPVASALLVGLLLTFSWTDSVLAAGRITILYDSIGKPNPELIMDWGYAALVEYNGKRILFDTGKDPAILENNVKALGVDLTKLDAIVLSHRHHDHVMGTLYVHTVNPNVTVYASKDAFFGGYIPKEFFKGVSSLSPEMRYFGGNPPDKVPRHQYLPYENIVRVGKVREIFPDIFLVPNKSPIGPEISLHIRSPKGQIVVTGCSHPGIETILESSKEIDSRIYQIVGGLHWVKTPEDRIEKSVASLKDKWQVKKVSSAHCTGEPGMVALERAFGERLVYTGLGSTIEF